MRICCPIGPDVLGLREALIGKIVERSEHGGTGSC